MVRLFESERGFMTSKRQKIIYYLKDGLTARETKELMKDVNITYIYKVRHNYSKKHKVTPSNHSNKKHKILRLISSKSYNYEDIATQVGCSKSYVYYVAKNVKKKPRLIHDRVCSPQDEYYTPLYAVRPLNKYLKKHSVIWCPFDTDDSLFVKYFRKKGHKVIATHINNGLDFFDLTPPPDCNYIISNPPYSRKELIFERLIEFGLPYAMLVNFTGLFSAKSRFDMFNSTGIEIMHFNSRVQYLTSYDDEKPKASPPFESGYICCGILGDKLVFERLNKSYIHL